jgi:hypothetical protein
LLTGWAVGFRDAVDLYAPLFQFLDNYRDVGITPTWNPFDNFGEPLAASGAAALFYPIRWVIQSLPISAVDQLSFYTAFHLLLAMLFSYRLAVGWGCRILPAIAVATAYGLGGSVLFQVTNVIYLVGAAWLPLALLSGEQTLTALSWSRRLTPLVVTSLASSMAILGGDPQIAYHAWLLLVGMAVMGALFAATGTRKFRATRLAIQLTSIGLIVLLTYGMAAMQIQSSREWVPWSERSAAKSPRSFWELLKQLQSGAETKDNLSTTAWWSEPSGDEHLNHVYQFSQPPWTFPELLWPNISGRPFPDNTRWIDGLPGAERMWAPSLYLGGLVLVLAIRQMVHSRYDRRTAFLTAAALWFALGACGWYGVGWLLHELGWAHQLGSPVGGVYWLMVIGLPEYVMFRYPAKLMVVVQLSLALLAGLQFTRLQMNPPRNSSFLPLLLLCVTGMAAASAWWWRASLAGLPVDDDAVGGAYRPELAAPAIFSALLHGAILLGFGWGWLRWRQREVHASLSWSLVGLAAMMADLFLANSGLCPVVPRQDLELAQQFYAPGLFANHADDDGQFEQFLEQATAVASAQWQAQLPDAVRRDPLRYWVQSRQLALIPKHHLHLASEANLLYPESLARRHGSFSPIESIDALVWSELVGQLPSERICFVTDPPIVVESESKQMRAVVVDRETDPPTLIARYLLSAVELPDEAATAASAQAAAVAKFYPERVHWLSQRPQVLEIECDTAEPGWLLVRDLFAPGWKALLIDLDNQETVALPVRRMQGLFRGVAVPAGRHQVVLYYQPDSLQWGRWLSIGTYLSVVLILAVVHTATGNRLE